MLALAAALFALAPAARPPPESPRRASPLESVATERPVHRRGRGEVAYATAARAYVDVGAREGLAPGAELTFLRRNRGVGKCTVDEVGDHNASCPATGLRVGDDAHFEPGALPPEPKLLPEPFDEDDLARRARVVTAAPPLPPAVFVAKATRAREAGPRRAEVALGGAAWTTSGLPGRGVGRVDVSLRSVPVGRWATVDVDARAERWVKDASGLGEGGDTRLLVWQAELDALLPWATLSAGRLRSFGALGASVLDGAAASFPLGPGRLGLFGGALPAPDTMAPGTERATAGGSWSFSGEGPRGLRLSTDGRVAMVRTPELGRRIEGALGARLWARSVDVSVEAHLGGGGDVQAPGALDSARVDFVARPGLGFTLGGGYRHSALELPDRFLEPAIWPGVSDAADGFASWDAGRYLRVAVTGGYSRDADSKLDRRWAGPELSAMRLVGGRLDVVLGYLEEQGWLAGRSAHAQVAFRAGERLRLVARGTWSYQKDLGLFRDEVGGYLAATVGLGSHLSLRLAALGRMPLLQPPGSGTTLGLAGNASLVGSY
jgi:hypothetical protein